MPGDLLERSDLLAELDGALAASVSTGQIVLVTGEAGIGKSALVGQFTRRHAADRFLVGLCDPLLTPRALGPLHDIARQIGGALAHRLSAAAGREAVFTALLDELDRPERDRSRQVVVVEDAHWADEATLDLLVFLGRRWEGTSAVLIVTYREDELGTDHPLPVALARLPANLVRLLRPAPLSEGAVAELARRAGRPAAGLHAVTGGNPLLVTETLGSGGASGPGGPDRPGALHVPDGADGADGADVPRRVRELVLARFAGLPPAGQEVVRLVAVVPTVTELWLLEKAVHPDPSVVEACEGAGLLVASQSMIGFRHELLRLAVEGAMSPLRRRELNRRVLQVLTAAAERSVDPARLAHHAREADDGAAVLRYAPAAARQAAGLAAHREAAGHYQAALAYADFLSGPARAELLEGYAYHGYLVGLIDEALTARRAALTEREAAGQTEQVGENLRWLSRLNWWVGKRDEAEAAGARAITVLENIPPGRQLAMAYSSKSQLDMLAHRSAAAIEWGSRALAVARDLDDRETLAHALTNIGCARLHGGDQAGRAELEQAYDLALRENLSDHAARALVNLAYTPLEQRDYRDARQNLDRALRFAAERDLAGYAQYLTGVQAWWRLDQGDYAGAERDARDVLRQREQPGVSVIPALVTLGRLQARRGDPEAEATLQDAARRTFGTGELQRVGPVAAARAEHAWLRGEADRVAKEAARGYELAVQLHHPWFAGELAWWLHRAGVEPTVPDWVADPYRLLLAGNWSAAAATWAELGCPYEQADALSVGDDDEALLHALALFDQLGAVAAARLVRRRLLDRGTVAVPRGPRPATVTNPAQLTGRQLEVLRLLAAGFSNADIASRLSLSVRTVDHHVSAVLAKLGVGSRAEALVAARRLGIASGLDRGAHSTP